MARTKGMLNLSGNLEVNAGAPLDARTVVPTAADLLVASNFQYKYVGMPVVVQATGDMYILTANDVTVAANWKQVGSGGGGSSYTAGDGIVIDNDEISTDNMPAADMAEIVTPLPSIGARYHTYSEDEQIVGYWVNGKPIYEKTFTNLNVSCAYNTWATVMSTSVTPDVDTLLFVFVNASLIPCIEIRINGTNYQAQNTMPSTTRIIKYLTLQYTKTTD